MPNQLFSLLSVEPSVSLRHVLALDFASRQPALHIWIFEKFLHFPSRDNVGFYAWRFDHGFSQ